jgi:hypothetical protein
MLLAKIPIRVSTYIQKRKHEFKTLESISIFTYNF